MTMHQETPVVIIRQSEAPIGLQTGEYLSARLSELGLNECAVSAVQVAPGYQAIVYAGDGFRGDSKVIAGGNSVEPPCLKRPPASLPFGSIRVIAALIPEPEARDRGAVRQAVEGWWPESLAAKESRIAWWREARFGCFIHWGVYSLTGGRWKGEPSKGYAEHLMRAKQIGLDEYKREFIDKFNPEQLDAEAWVQQIKSAGMKYVVITAKHHDGFAIYPSDAYPSFDIRLTPFQRDPLMELKDACRRHGLAYGFYYSHAFDWEHPDAPGNDWEYTNPGGDLKLYEGPGKLWFSEHPELLPRVADYYVSGKAIPQIIELIRRYEPDILWFDTPHKLPLSENLRILQAIREADSRVVVNGRLARGPGFDSFADYVNTADRALDIFPCEGDWETIPTTNESYGYSADDHSHKPAGVFIQLLAKSAARGGNVLMNLGPMGNGKIDDRDLPILERIGGWLAVNGESIYGTVRTPLPVQSWGESTRKGNRLYLHVFDWPEDGQLVLAGLKSHIRQAWLLEDAGREPLETRRLNGCDWLIRVPGRSRHASPNLSVNRVVAVEVDGEPAVHAGRLLSGAQPTVLKAFDAEVSQGIGYGDGKRGNDYIRDWTSVNQFVKWRVRLHQDVTFKLALAYSAPPGAACQGSYAIAAGGRRIEGHIAPSATADRLVAEHEVSLSAGEHDLMLLPLRIDGDELMRLYSVTLVPLAAYAGQGERAEEIDMTDVGD
ncbi:Alpha-L-fucosidase [Paenibacillus sp. UNCCL117]|uniref:alpha-L-fucosidase n=1 Tax=unclassified Paenibacillus TaxID=185978 RepID=UPI0008807EA4|nr:MULTISPECIES: alpha-L-fucosidase [unclassified Paenibacillus]SDE20111.1 Alpha-L-fucosidase [Paenibacillus sp. cl123]SFW61853.1 Alpha-L-fucosidase [Paenibacillus sp. UNCCL117]